MTIVMDSKAPNTFPAPEFPQMADSFTVDHVDGTGLVARLIVGPPGPSWPRR